MAAKCVTFMHLLCAIAPFACHTSRKYTLTQSVLNISLRGKCDAQSALNVCVCVHYAQAIRIVCNFHYALHSVHIRISNTQFVCFIFRSKSMGARLHAFFFGFHQQCIYANILCICYDARIYWTNRNCIRINQHTYNNVTYEKFTWMLCFIDLSLLLSLNTQLCGNYASAI